MRVSDGIRTRGRRDHNPELYQLSYAHQRGTKCSGGLCRPRVRRRSRPLSDTAARVAPDPQSLPPAAAASSCAVTSRPSRCAVRQPRPIES